MRHADRLTILRLAAEADLDPRSARKALERGPDSLRGRAGEKAGVAMQRLGLLPPATPSVVSASPTIRPEGERAAG